MLVYLLVQSQLLLLENHLLGLKFVDFFTNFTELGLIVNQIALVCDPVSLSFDVLNLYFFDLALNTVALGLVGALVLVDVAVLG